MNQSKLVYIVLILLAVYLGIRIIKSLLPLLLFAAIFAVVYAFINPDFRAKAMAGLTYLKNRLF
jgi:hypothetical protein